MVQVSSLGRKAKHLDLWFFKTPNEKAVENITHYYSLPGILFPGDTSIRAINASQHWPVY
jgi:hypothetical protein